MIRQYIIKKVTMISFLSVFKTKLDSMQLRDRTMQVFFFISTFLALFLFTGCGPSPQERLKAEREQLRTAAVETLFAEKTARAPDMTAYVVPGKELIQISRGVKRCSDASQNFELMTCHASYHVSRLKVSSEIFPGHIKEYDQPPYSHRAIFQLNVRYSGTEKTPDAIPGMEFHAWTPENYTKLNVQQKKTMKEHLTAAADFSMDHAVVLHCAAQKKLAEKNETRDFEILYNSKKRKWELAKAKKMPSTPPPPEYLESQIEQFMMQKNFRKFEAESSGGKKVFWFSEKDGDAAANGLVKLNGTWRQAEPVKQTVFLQKCIADWKKQSKISFRDLEHFLAQIKRSPLADDREQAIRLAENAMLNVFINYRDDMTVQNMNRVIFLLEFLNSNSAAEVLDRRTLAEIAQQKIASIDTCLSSLRQLYAKEFMLLKTLLNSATDSNNWNAFKKKFFDLSSLNFPGYYPWKNPLRKIEDIKDLTGNNKTALQCQDTFVRIDMLKKVVDGDEHMTRYILKNAAAFAPYFPIMGCTACQGRGKKNCSQCKNSGICALCGGKGTRFVTQKQKQGWVTRDVKVQIQCNEACTHCERQTVSCPACSGAGIALNKSLYKETFTKELTRLRGNIDKVISQLNQIPERENTPDEALLEETIIKVAAYQNAVVQKVTLDGIHIAHRKGFACLQPGQLTTRDENILAAEILQYNALLIKKQKEDEAAEIRRAIADEREQRNTAAQRAEMRKKEQQEAAARKKAHWDALVNDRDRWRAAAMKEAKAKELERRKRMRLMERRQKRIKREWDRQIRKHHSPPRPPVSREELRKRSY